jgi:hypothetical protein
VKTSPAHPFEHFRQANTSLIGQNPN